MKKFSANFTHLHVHTSAGSLLDGIINIPEYVDRVKELGMSSCSVTDHGSLAGIIKFYKECKKKDIHPLLGIEAYVTQDEDNKENKTKDNNHLVLIAKDREGLKRLFELSSAAYLNNFYYKPRIHIQKLQYLKGHCIATSACLKGVLSQFLEQEVDNLGQIKSVSDPLSLAEKQLDFLLQCFNKDFFIELQDWDDGTGLNKEYCKFLLSLGKRKGVPFVVTTDAHYLRKEDHAAHEIAIATQLKKTIDEYRAQEEMRYGPHFYIKTPEEMLTSAKNLNCEEAFYNTIDIINRCNVEIELGKRFYFPKYDITQDKDYQEFINNKK